MADKAISNLYTDNPITTPGDDDLIEIGGVASGAVKFSDLKAAVLAVLGSLALQNANAVAITGGTVAGLAGHLTFTPDNTYDIGANGATRPRTGYFSQYVFAAGALVADVFSKSSGTRLTWAANGIGTLTNDAQTSFNLLQFGGTSSAFPALKRYGVELQTRLADDSDYGDFRAATFTGSPSGLLGAGPNITGTAGSLTIDTGWTANADAGDKTKVIASSASTATIGAALDIISAGSGTLLIATAEKVKALEVALVSLLAPNA